MLKRIKEYFKTKNEYRHSMMGLASAITEKINDLLDAELARTAVDKEAMEAVTQMNTAFSPEEMSGYLNQISDFLTEMKQPDFRNTVYQNIIDTARSDFADNFSH